MEDFRLNQEKEVFAFKNDEGFLGFTGNNHKTEIRFYYS